MVMVPVGRLGAGILTNPAARGAIGGFLGNLGAEVVSGLEGFGGFLGDVSETFSGIFEAAAPAINLAAQFGAFGGGAQPFPQQQAPAPVTGPQTNPAHLLQMGAPTPGTFFSRLAGGGELSNLTQAFQQVGDPGVGPGGGAMSMGGGISILPTTGAVRARFPRLVQALVRTPSGNQRVVTYRNMGTPLLYSGDLAAKKRVNRVRGRLGKR